MRGSIADLNMQSSEQSLPEELSQELKQLLVLSTHRIEKARDIASKYLNRLIMSFPSLMCDPPLVVAILEVLTLMSRACEDEFTDEVRDPNGYDCLMLIYCLVQSSLHLPLRSSEHHAAPERQLQGQERHISPASAKLPVLARTRPWSCTGGATGVLAEVPRSRSTHFADRCS
jgi:hypothetical protein